MDKLKQEQDRIARLQAENHAALKAAQEGTEEDGWQTFEKTPERQNMTKPEVTQEARRFANEWWAQAVRDGVIRRGNPNDRPLIAAFFQAIQAAEQRPMTDRLTEIDRLRRVHELRMKAHGFPIGDFPIADKELRAAEHGSPHDTAVHMARWHLKLAQKLKDEGLLE